MKRSGIDQHNQDGKSTPLDIVIDGDSVKIGNTKVPRFKTKDTSKVPDILFYNVPQVTSQFDFMNPFYSIFLYHLIGFPFPFFFFSILCYWKL
jgi:hypothetical protein